jgi:hypothetical protein
MLGDFHLLDGLTQRGTVIGAVLAYDSNLLGVHGHVYLLKSSQEKPC